MIHAPINKIEEKILLLFKLKGYDSINIEFKNSGGTSKRCIKYKYWEEIDIDDIIYIQENANVMLQRTEWDDEDTGLNFAYHIIIDDEEE
tara:strand:- start:922 stop:1191 length:270 start_codon:yes stop_codon:yes gene_type:complete